MFKTSDGEHINRSLNRARIAHTSLIREIITTTALCNAEYDRLLGLLIEAANNLTLDNFHMYEFVKTSYVLNYHRGGMELSGCNLNNWRFEASQ